MKHEKIKAIPVSISDFTTGTSPYQLKQQNAIGFEPIKNKRNDYY
jgi:hypothetical protein